MVVKRIRSSAPPRAGEAPELITLNVRELEYIIPCDTHVFELIKVKITDPDLKFAAVAPPDGSNTNPVVADVN
jgi:hypothetical protein